MNAQDNQDSENQQQRTAEDLPVDEERAGEVKGGLDPGKTLRFKPGKDLQDIG